MRLGALEYKDEASDPIFSLPHIYPEQTESGRNDRLRKVSLWMYLTAQNKILENFDVQRRHPRITNERVSLTISSRAAFPKCAPPVGWRNF